tara:strand:- start:119 stop:457 length:339 start_codon:yes stop_codon:yes gene_type:complete
VTGPDSPGFAWLRLPDPSKLPGRRQAEGRQAEGRRQKAGRKPQNKKDGRMEGWTGWMDRMDGCIYIWMDAGRPEDRKTGRPEDIGIKKDAYESAPILIDPYLLWSNFKYTPT